jgi:pimeloyl-ACP methyl ester carboxylesterase
MYPVASALQSAGARVVAPTASWSDGYVPYGAVLNEVGGYVAALRAQGVRRIAIVGQSLGANIALGYGAQRGGVDAIVAMAPGHKPDRMLRFTGESLQRAKAMMARGQGNARASFTDVNQGRAYEVSTTAAAYVSFFSPDGPALIQRNAARLRHARLLWIVGTDDPGARSVARGGKVMVVSGGHFQTPRNGAGAAVAWLESL